MPDPFVIEGYAIVTVDGMIADEHGVMPESLKYEADQRAFSVALDQCDLILHGRHSDEGHENSPQRRRFWLTRRVASLERRVDAANDWYWNPGGIELFAACRAVGLEGGKIAVLGGPSIYEMFLPRYSAFSLSRAGNLWLPGGTTLFPSMGQDRAAEDLLRAAGLALEATRVLDGENALTTTRWVRR
jgi:dihydrofolate reductase